MLTSPRLLLAGLAVAVVAGCFASNASAQHWITRPQDWGKKGVIVFPKREESTSSLQFVTGPYIDANGNVWSGSGSGGSAGSVVGKASLQYNNQGRAYWVSNYSNIYGRVQSPIRATKHDKGEPLGTTEGSIKQFKNGKWYVYEKRNGQYVLTGIY